MDKLCFRDRLAIELVKHPIKHDGESYITYLALTIRRQMDETNIPTHLKEQLATLIHQCLEKNYCLLRPHQKLSLYFDEQPIMTYIHFHSGGTLKRFKTLETPRCRRLLDLVDALAQHFSEVTSEHETSTPTPPGTERDR